MKVDKQCKHDYKVLEKTATKSTVKALKTDSGGNFYVFDLYDSGGVLLALNRYVYKDSPKQPFGKLSAADELVLKPPIVETPMEIENGK